MTNGYQQFRPAEPLCSVVDAYWINRPGEGAQADRVLPDGCIDLVFHGGGAGGGRLFSSALIERPAYFEPAAPGWFVGVRFRPAMARAVLDLAPLDCRDRTIHAAEIEPEFGALERALQECASPAQALAALRRAIVARLATPGGTPPGRVREAIMLLARGGDAAHLRAVARALGITERSLHRDLVRWSGLAPKPLARILRMQRTLRALRGGSAPLALTAVRMGYADQAHMTRELKALTGFTPAQIAAPVRNLQDAA